MAGLSLESATVEERGLQYDRRWMLTDPSGNCITQREINALALLQPIMGKTGFCIQHRNLRTLSPEIPFEITGTGKEKAVHIWDDTVPAHLVDPLCDEWFSDVLKTPCQLVVMPLQTQRMLHTKYNLGNQMVSFADAFPYLGIGLATLADLNNRLTDQIKMNRFRPNLVFSGTEPFAEDTWDHFKIGHVLFRAIKPCSRCMMTTIDQEYAKGGKEPLRTLATYRLYEGKTQFGQNIIYIPEGGIHPVIHVGDRIEILDYKSSGF